MNLFDLVAALVILVSALIGFSRGVVMELVALFAFTLAATAALYLLPFTAPLARAEVHPAWAANAAAVAVSFLIVYFGVRLLGGGVSRSLRSQATLGTLDRTVGLAFGVARALVVLGVVYLVFNATPFGRPPDLLTQAKLYPLARGSGVALASLAPGGVKQMEGFGSSLKARMGGGDPGPPEGPVDVGAAYGPPPSDDAANPSAAPILQIDNGETPRRHHHRPAPAPVE